MKAAIGTGMSVQKKVPLNRGRASEILASVRVAPAEQRRAKMAVAKASASDRVRIIAMKARKTSAKRVGVTRRKAK